MTRRTRSIKFRKSLLGEKRATRKNGAIDPAKARAEIEAAQKDLKELESVSE